MTERKIWMDGSLVNWDEAKIHILTHALHYGTGVFEGIRCYKTIDGQAVFRLPEHIQRLLDSGKIYFMDLRYSKEQLQEAVIDTIKANEIEECYVRLIAYYGYGKMGVNPMPNKVSVAIALWNWDEYLRADNLTYGIRMMVSSWARIDGRSMPVHAKATANYANSALARVEALKSGFDEAIMLNVNGMVVEASAENIFIVKDNVLITAPIMSGALNGITRDSILTLARDNRISCEIRDISRDELYLADEVFLTGTAAEIKPVVEIDNRTIGDGKVGAISQRLKMLYESVVHGENKKFSKKWLMLV
ncbi:MAG TPA: branched-chain amino acid transaminase [Nitrososphaeraceae archaeon]|jgi:branched-chain amino acid aminotransferase|nr:branched-chain amino acid transaminase [Nitrososphaeraceae archaeon]